MKLVNPEPLRQHTVRETCPECGYTAVHIILDKKNKCPGCEPCPRCGRKIMRCACLEGQ
jgi:rRNA maturation protein Nop10